jgi:hypothetical protein
MGIGNACFELWKGKTSASLPRKQSFFFSFGCVAYFEVLFPFLTVLLQNVLGCTHKATTSTVRDITQEKKIGERD